MRRALGDLVDDPLGRDELGDGLLERRRRADFQLAHRADTVAFGVAVAQPGDLGAEHLGEVLVLRQVGEDPLGRLGEAVFDFHVVGSHRPQTIRLGLDNASMADLEAWWQGGERVPLELGGTTSATCSCAHRARARA